MWVWVGGERGGGVEDGGLGMGEGVEKGEGVEDGGG